MGGTPKSERISLGGLGTEVSWEWQSLWVVLTVLVACKEMKFRVPRLLYQREVMLLSV